MPTPIVVCDATRWDVDGIAEVLTVAATHTSLGRWLYPDALDRDHHLHTFFTTWTTATVQYGQARYVWDTPGCMAAAALWITCPQPAGPQLALTVPDGRDPGRRRALLASLAACHPAQPHEHLLALAVRPRLQDNRIGTALLTDHHQRTTSPPFAHHTMAIGPESTLFRRLGYQPLDNRTEPLPDDGPRLTPLWRTPSPAPIVLRPSAPSIAMPWAQPNRAPPNNSDHSQRSSPDPG